MIPVLKSLDEQEEVIGLDGERTIYNIPEANYPRFEKEIAKLSRKSERMIGLPIQAVPISYEMVPVGNGKERKVIQVYLQAETPKIAGWTFVARLDHSNETGNVIRSVPNTGVEIPEKFRTAAPNCDHCGVRRKRRDTFVIRNDETGDFQQVGSSCLEDFFGHDPYKIARLAEYLGYASEAARGSEEYDEAQGLHDHRYINLEEFLLCTARVVLNHGWVSGKAARESEERAYDTGRVLISTRDRAHTLFNSRNSEAHPDDFSQEERDLIENSLEWAQGVAENPQSDYEHNIAVIANASYIESRSLGLAASIVGVYYNQARKAAGVSRTKVGKLDHLVTFMSDAKKRIEDRTEGKRHGIVKSPTIHLSFNGGSPLAIALAGERSKNAGCVYLSDGGPYGRNIYYGRVTPEGDFLPSSTVSPKAMDAITAVLTAIANNPAETALKYGRKTNKCCFCNRPLDNPRSVENGYGEICAHNYGLPWK